MEPEWRATKVEFHKELYDLHPWYHDFAYLGLQTIFKEPEPSTLGARVAKWVQKLSQAVTQAMSSKAVEKGEKFSLRALFSNALSPHLVNQHQKEQIIVPFLQYALETLGNAPSCLDLFCADGYYSGIITRLCPEAVIIGVDLDPMEIKRAQTAARLLQAQHSQFVVADVWEFARQAKRYDLVLCTGGLYHLREPQRFLEMLHPICADFLLIQSAITLETEAPDYFISPAPGWKHGSRFTHAGLRRWLKEIGWDIVKEDRNELVGNTRLCDRGASYFLCRVRSQVKR